jgi:hypothetical protein
VSRGDAPIEILIEQAAALANGLDRYERAREPWFRPPAAVDTPPLGQ